MHIGLSNTRAVSNASFLDHNNAARPSVTVKYGDSLSSIAAHHKVSLSDLIAANPQLRNPDVIYPGDKINLPEHTGNHHNTSTSSPHSSGAPHATSHATPDATQQATASPVSGAKVTPGKLPDTKGLNEARKHDLYAGYIKQFGNSAAKQDLANGRKVVLSLRVDTLVNANQGKGAYDDRMVMLWIDKAGGKHAQEFKANTEPSGQYEDGGKYMRKPVGANYGGDKRGDLGRLIDGTYHYQGTGTFLGAKAFWSTGDQVSERDTNHNGRFDDGVKTPRQDYGMYIHRGGADNTWSAGCQTLPPAEHDRFFSTLGGQNSLNYVLVNTKKLSASTRPAAQPQPTTQQPGTKPQAAIDKPTTFAANGLPTVGDPTQHKLTEADYQRAAKTLGVNVAAIKAVAEVESTGAGFLADGRPKILYERHIFSSDTHHKYDATHPNISNRHSGGYGAGGAHQYDRLKEAMRLDSNHALQAASWGKFQIMGFNYTKAGYSNVKDFVAAMYKSEGKQLDAFVSFIKANPAAHRALQKHDWASFAYNYNGENYKQNAYDTKMAAAYARYSR
jgi:N-acetylmuramidase/LysM domain